MRDLIEAAVAVPPESRARQLAADEIIVSKTDRKGIIRYVNDTFCRISGFREHELVGRPHNVIRHSFMPAAIFAALWQRLKAREEVFVHVVNRCRDGGHYWVFAHVTPSLAPDGTVRGYHSTRRAVRGGVPTEVVELYAELRRLELSAASRREGLRLSSTRLATHLAPWQGDLSAWAMSLATRSLFTVR